MLVMRLALVILAAILAGLVSAAAQAPPLNLDRSTRLSAEAMAARARAIQTATARERERERDFEVVGPPRFFERLFAGLPPLPPQFQFDPNFPTPPGFDGRGQQEASLEPSEVERRPIDPKFLPQIVSYTGPEKPGTIVIDTASRFLYYVLEDGRAKRYGIGVGRSGFTW